jgi:outer membrane protein assembly factor BamA
MRSPPSRLARRAALAVSTAGFGLAAAGCGASPPCSPLDAKGCIIEKVRVFRQKGSEGKVGEDEVKERLATAESSLLVTSGTVNLFGERGTLFFRYERFDRLVLERDLARIERYYRSRGYYEARVRAARVLRTGGSTVKVEVHVDEGAPSIVTKVDLELKDPKKPLPSDPPDLGPALVEAKNLIGAGTRFEEATFELAKSKILRAMTDRGYAYAQVTGSAGVDLEHRTVSVAFTVETGPPSKFGEISIEGLGELPEAPVRTAIRIRPGRRFSTEALDQAQVALSDLGVFGAVSVDVGLDRDKDGVANPVVPVRFVVQKASLRSIQLGGGAELGSRVQAHLVAGWENKNFFGGLRRLLLEARGGVVFYPLQLVNWDAPDGVTPLPDVRTRAELRQPGFIEERTTGHIGAEANFYRPETADAPGSTRNLKLYENLEVQGNVGVERPFLRSVLRLGVDYNAQLSVPLPVTWAGTMTVPKGFESLFISYAGLQASVDLRKGATKKRDPLNPHSGVYLGASIQFAGIGGDAQDVRLKPELRAYAPISASVTLGFRVTGGLLFPLNYGSDLFAAAGCAAADAECQNRRARDVQIMQLRGFYSGGTSSNRGYGLNGVNPKEKVPSLFTSPSSSVPVPIGGRWLWDASLELRFPIAGSFGGAVFADASDVWNEEAGFRPHFSPGLGLRYETPVGPVRLDIGVRVPCAQVLGTCVDDYPGPFGLPVYPLLAIGQAF